MISSLDSFTSRFLINSCKHGIETQESFWAQIPENEKHAKEWIP